MHSANAERSDAKVRAIEDALSRLGEPITEAQAKGVLREGDPMQLALLMWTSMHGLAVLLIEGQLGRYDRPVEAKKLAHLVAELMLEGLLPRATPRRR